MQFDFSVAKPHTSHRGDARQLSPGRLAQHHQFFAFPLIWHVFFHRRAAARIVGLQRLGVHQDGRAFDGEFVDLSVEVGGRRAVGFSVIEKNRHF